MKNVEHFGDLTPRMNQFREKVLNELPYIDATRAVLCTEAYQQNLHQSAVMKRALMLKNILEKMPIYIEDETLIVGNQASSNCDAPVFPEYTLEFIMNELDLFEKRDGDVFYITEETKQQLRDIAPFWENNNLRAKGTALLPDEVSVYMETGFFGMEGKLNSGDAHLAVDYAQLLKIGLKGYEDRAQKLKADLDLCIPENIDKYQFYKAVIITIEAVRTFAQRFSDLAATKAQQVEGTRQDELLEIAARLTAKGITPGVATLKSHLNKPVSLPRIIEAVKLWKTLDKDAVKQAVSSVLNNTGNPASKVNDDKSESSTNETDELKNEICALRAEIELLRHEIGKLTAALKKL